jgi:phosphopantothenoylcysteine decarboxylase/phosphopantothenate--cysteine ligase
MNVNMYVNPIVKGNIERLRSLGYHILEPEEGELACGREGKGRLVDPSEIVEEIEDLFESKDFAGETVLVTAGPTRESIDPVRFLSNFSSGRMGYAIARVARRRGAEVILVSGPTALPDPRGVDTIRIESALEMKESVMAHFERASILVKAAAVADYRPKNHHNQKIKKLSNELQLPLERTPDILLEIGKVKKRQIIVGFAAETEDLESNAMAKLKEKNLDFIVANDLTLPGAGFESETNQVKIIERSGKINELPLMSKEAVAMRLLDIIGHYKKSAAKVDGN